MFKSFNTSNQLFLRVSATVAGQHQISADIVRLFVGSIVPPIVTIVPPICTIAPPEGTISLPVSTIAPPVGTIAPHIGSKACLPAVC